MEEIPFSLADPCRAVRDRSTEHRRAREFSPTAVSYSRPSSRLALPAWAAVGVCESQFTRCSDRPLAEERETL
jgi:hypothetical protein